MFIARIATLVRKPPIMEITVRFMSIAPNVPAALLWNRSAVVWWSIGMERHRVVPTRNAEKRKWAIPDRIDRLNEDVACLESFKK